MIKTIKKKLKKIKFIHKINLVYHLASNKSSLNKLGWFQSSYSGMPITKSNEPIPWITYSSFFFLEERIKNNFEIFEYGSGNSTLWWSKKCKSVTTVEHDLNWFEIIKQKVPTNVKYIFRELGDRYINEVSNHNKKFDIVVVDGRLRNDCIKMTIESLNPLGVIILDNSERMNYSKGKKLMISKGFKELEFSGFGPIGLDIWSTSIFYRINNCLEI